MSAPARPMLSAMDVLALLRPKRKAAPAQVWRNWYRALRDHDTVVGFKHAGDEFPGKNIYPSKDLAETEAEEMRRWMEQLSEIDGSTVPYLYLGAREEPHA